MSRADQQSRRGTRRMVAALVVLGVVLVAPLAWCLSGERGGPSRGVGGGAGANASANASANSSVGWIVSGGEATRLVKGGATVLDVRGRAAFALGHVAGAQRVTWQQFSRPSGARRGELLGSDAALRRAIEAVGVREDAAVVVVGDPRGGWGEEGRIVWMLRALGHTRATLVDGGHSALVKAGAPVARGGSSEAARGTFHIKRRPALSASTAEVRAALKDAKTVILDTREAREFDGATPYGEQRGGHVPGAKHLYYKALLNADGTLKPRAEIERLLAARGITRKTPVIAYCTGGIRSGWIVAVLHHLGYLHAQNYAGSMWAWSAEDAKGYPLE